MISILLPTRNRPDNCEEFITHASSSCTNPNYLEYIFYVDNDDIVTIPKLEQLKTKYDISWIHGPRIVMSRMLNELALKAKNDIFFLSSDDILLRTQGWDKIVLEQFDKFADKLIMVFGNDGYNKDGTFGTHFFLHRRWMEIIGYISPPYFSANYVDTWWNEVAINIGRRIHVPIMTEHMHYANNKREADQTMKEKDARLSRDYMFSIWFNTFDQRKQDAEKLLAVIDGGAKLNYKRLFLM